MAPVLRQISCGRLAAHASSPVLSVSEDFDLKDWTPGTSVTASIVSGLIRFTTSGSNVFRLPRYTRLAARADYFIQSVGRSVSTGASTGPALRIENDAAATNGVWGNISQGFSGPQGLREIAGGSQVGANTSTSSLAVSTLYRASLVTDAADEARMYHFARDEDRSLTLVAGSAGVYAGHPGVIASRGSAGSVEYSEFYVMENQYVRVVGPAGNWRARVKDAGGTILAQADAVAGVALVDMVLVALPTATRVEIYDLDTASIVLTLDPTRRVWGGDVYAWYADAPTPNTTALTRDVLGRRAAYAADPTSGVEEAFDTGDWAEGGNGGLSLQSGSLRYTNVTGDADVNIREVASEADGPDHFLQAILENSSLAGTAGMGVSARMTSAAPGSLEFVVERGGFNGTLTFGLAERDEPTTLQTDLRSQSNLSAPARVMLDMDGSVARGFNFSRPYTSRLTGVTLTGDFAGLWKVGGSNGEWRQWSAYYRMRSAYLEVAGSNPAAEFLAVMYDAADQMLAWAESSGGVAVIDCYAERVRFPNATRLDVIPLADATLTPALSATPSERLWAGDEWSFALAPDVPDAPTVDSVGGTSASLSWDPVADATSYKVFRASAAEGPFVEVDEVSDEAFNDSGLEPLTQYWWRIAACNSGGCSAQSPSATATTIDVVPAVPAAPEVGSPSTGSLLISWGAVPYASEGYGIYRSLTAFGGFELVGSTAAGVTAFLDTGLEAATEYFYRIQACSSLGCSDPSDPGSGATLAEQLFLPCTVVLEVFEADGETVAWEVATDPGHPLPYLLFPDSYGAREIDPVTGAATIGTIDVTVADVPLVPGDQDGGFVTARLDGIHGRRCRLRRYVNVQQGFVVIADGPAGPPRLHESYAGYTWSIRDVREIERSLRPFSTGGTCALLPRGPIAPWGATDDGFLLEAVQPVTGEMFISFNESAGEYFGTVLLTNEEWDFSAIPDVKFPAEFEIGEDAVEALNGVVIGDRMIYPFADVLWRPALSDEPFRVARPSEPRIFGYRLGGVQPGRVLDTEEPTQALASVRLFAAEAVPDGFPANGDPVEVIVRHRGPPTEGYPYYFEGTLGNLLRALYDRSLERAPVIPGSSLYDPAGLEDVGFEFGGGIRIDEAAFDLLTTPVLFRLTEAVDDGRAWAEEQLYAPSGWIPALDEQGRISPVSRARPDAVTLPEVNNSNAEPAAEWDAGQRVVTRCRLSYRRYFKPTNPFIEKGPDGVAVRDVVLEYVDPDASLRHNEQLEAFDASLFGSVGDPDGTIADVGGEVGQVLGQGLLYEVLQRYRLGAPAFRVAVLRSSIPGVREGSWIPVDLSWLPTLGGPRRGLVAEAAQVLSIEDADCDWRTLLLEVSPVAAPPGYFTDLERVEDVPQPGYFTTLMLVDDVESEES